MSRVRVVITLACLLFVIRGTAIAAPPACTTYSLQVPKWDNSKPNTITAGLGHTIDKNATMASASWILTDYSSANSSAVVAITSVEYEDVKLAGGGTENATVLLTTAVALSPLHTYYLVAKNIKYTDCPTTQPLSVPIKLQHGRVATKALNLTPSKTRDDSDFYLAPTVDGATGQKASYTIDGKLSISTWLKQAEFGKDKFGKYTYRPAVIFAPGIDSKISSNPKEDGNSVTFQLPFKFLFPIPIEQHPSLGAVVPAVIATPAFLIEADKNFHDLNAILAYNQLFVLRCLCKNNLQIVPEPLIGVEVGSNLKSQQAGAYPDSILRAVFGLHTGVSFLQSSKATALFTIQADYIRRLLLMPEPVYGVNSKGKLALLDVGTQPRDHVNVTVSYNITQYVSLNATYEYGSLPPVYTKVNNKYTFGIALRGQLLYRPQGK